MKSSRTALQALVCTLVLALAGALSFAARPPIPLHQPKNEYRVHTIDVDQGQAVLVQTLQGKNILIDAGEDYAAPRMIAYLKKLGVKKIDWLLISHRHMDHIGGVFELARAFPVENVVTPWKRSAVPTTALVWMAPLRKNLSGGYGGANASTFHTGIAGKTFDFGGGAKAEVIWPPKATGGLRIGDYNEESMVVRVSQAAPSGEKATFVVGGDLGWQLERHLAATKKAKIRADGLIGNHHGSKGSFDARYLEAVAGRPSRLLDAVDSEQDSADQRLAHQVLRRCQQRNGKFLADKVGLALYKNQRQRDPLVNRLADYFREDRRINGHIPWMTYSAGIDNPYQHPNTERMALAALLGTTMLGTDIHGNIVMLRKVGRDGKWEGERWEGHTLDDSEIKLPKVAGRMPAYKRNKDPRNPYDNTARMANYLFSLEHPDPTASWSQKAAYMPAAGEEANAKFLAIAREARSGRAQFVREFRAKMNSKKAATMKMAAAKTRQLWHGVQLSESPWVQEGRIIMLDRNQRQPRQGNLAPRGRAAQEAGNALADRRRPGEVARGHQAQPAPEAGSVLSDRRAAWRREQATSRQIALMNRLGLRVPPRLTKGKASDLIAAHYARHPNGS